MSTAVDQFAADEAEAIARLLDDGTRSVLVLVVVVEADGAATATRAPIHRAAVQDLAAFVAGLRKEADRLAAMIGTDA